MYKKIYKNMCFLSMLTLILTSLIILSACYSVFTARLKNELESETEIFAEFFNTNEDPLSALNKIDLGATQKRITLTDANGIVLFDTETDTFIGSSYINKPEIKKAADTLFGSDTRRSEINGKMSYYYAVKLNNSMIFRICASVETTLSFFIYIILAVLILATLIYLFALIIAKRLTEYIVKPIENMHISEDSDIDNIYDEIRPFVKRIIDQNKEIKRQMKKVSQQKFRIQTIADNINEGLIILDKNSNILSLNSCSCELFNISEFGYKKKTISDITDNQSILTAANVALKGKKSNVSFNVENKKYQAFCSPVFNNDIVNGMIILIFDISSISDSEKMRREFTANVSHELKTPLTSIHGYAQIITSGIAKAEDINGFAQKIEKESSRLIILIDDIIKLSKLDENTQHLEKQKINLKTVVFDVYEMLKSRVDEKNISVSISGEDSVIFANLSQIIELVYNLFDNAVKYNKQDGSIFIKISENTLSVEDTGIGIPEEYLPRIFERFFRVDKSHSKKVNGTGLGLSIVKHIAQANNAVINVDSKIDNGTIFTVTFNNVL